MVKEPPQGKVKSAAVLTSMPYDYLLAGSLMKSSPHFRNFPQPAIPSFDLVRGESTLLQLNRPMSRKGYCSLL